MAAIITSGVLLGGFSLPAQAAEGQNDTSRSEAVKALLEKTDSKIARAGLTKEDRTWRVSSKEFEEARAKTRNVRAKSRAKVSKEVREFVQEAADRGHSYRTEDVEVIPLLDGEVEAVLPKETSIDFLTVEVSDGDVTLESQVSNPDESDAEFAGPGMADWDNDGSGQYILRVPGVGEGHFTWKRNKLSSDGDNAYDWYQYSRWGVGKPANVNNYPDPYVKVLRVQSYPFDSIEPNLVTWEDIDPKTSFTGDCNGQPITVGVAAPVASIGYSFQDCDEYDVWYNSSKPGSQWIEMDQGLILTGGGEDREAAYTHTIKVKQGTAGSMHDFQRVVFEDGFTDATSSCEQYDASTTC
ncbi:hypothetical protein [Streptomyces pratensis]|uniref:hypothetical protein n=1 Tax=Streptomyces pratensis TaxID=1169025 RepID=UPI0030198491